METLSLNLFKARDAENSFAVALADDPAESWRASSGFGRDFEKVWGLELQSDTSPEVATVNWETVLERALEAYSLSDPVITNFEWPQTA